MVDGILAPVKRIFDTPVFTDCPSCNVSISCSPSPKGLELELRHNGKSTGETVNSHKNVKLTANGREEMVRRMVHSPAAIAAAGFGVSVHRARKWGRRFLQGGSEALADRSSRTKHCRSALTEDEKSCIAALRRDRLTGDEIALQLGLGRSSVFRVLHKLECSRCVSGKKGTCIALSMGKAWADATHRHKRLGKIDGIGHRMIDRSQARCRRPGWEYLRMCVDDASSVAYTLILSMKRLNRQ